MIKFVCSSCGERLSVSDQHGGRKGVCPNCQAVNRIPLKGYSETQPKTPATTRPVDKPTAGTLPAKSAVADATGEKSHARPASAEMAPADHEPQRRPIIYSGERREIVAGDSSIEEKPVAPVDFRSTPVDGRRKDEQTSHRAILPELPVFTPPLFDESAEPDSAPEGRRLPKKVKLALLILAALAMVATLYFALLFALHAMVPPG